jgi:hypothetical protein
MEQRAEICCLALKGLNPGEFYSELESVYHEDVLAPPTVYKWHTRFRDAPVNLSDDPRSGRRRKSDLAESIS